MRRQDKVKQNLTGGTSAPPKAAGGNNAYVSGAHPFRTGVGPAQPVPPQKAGISGGTPAPQQAAPTKPQTPLPWDVAAANQEAGAYRKLSDTESALGANQLRIEQNYGLEGPWADFKTNPYSQAALLQRQYNNAQKGTINSYASGHHLYSGALGRAREGNTFSYDQSRNALANEYAEAKTKNIAERQAAQDAFRETKDEATWNRINAGLKEEPDATAVPKGHKNSKGKDRARKNIKGKK